MSESKYSKIKKSFLAFATATTMLLAALPITASVNAATNAPKAKEEFTAFGTFDNEPNGVKTLTETNGRAGGHVNFTVDELTSHNANMEVLRSGENADYLQFDFKSDSNTPVELFFFKFKFYAGMYERPIKAGEKFFLQEKGSSDWTEATIAGSATYYTPAQGCSAAMSIPAEFEGKIRVPMSSFVGNNPANDTYIFDEDKVDAMEMYMHSPDPAHKCTFVIDNVGYVKSVPAPTETFKAFGTFDNETDGVKTLVETNGRAGGHVNFTVDELTSHNANMEVLRSGENADYLQFDFKSDSNTPVELFFFKFKFYAGMYERPIKAGEKFFLQAKGSSDWTEATIAGSATYYTPAQGCSAAMSIPAEFEGKIRVPMSSFVGSSAANDTYIFDEDKVDAMEMYMHSPDPAHKCTFIIDNVGFVMTEKAPAPVNKDALNAAVESFNGWAKNNEAKYTADSWATYMANCKTTLDMPENTQPEVDAKKAAVEKLNMSPATDVLVEKPADPDTKPTKEIFKPFGTFDKEANGVMALTERNGRAGGHVNFTLDEINQHNVDLKVLNEGENATYLQFDLKNGSEKQLEIFFFKFKFYAGMYERPIKAGQKFYMQSNSSSNWIEATIADSGTFYNHSNGVYDCMIIPAEFEGKIRVPMASFIGRSADNDSYIFNENKVDAMEMYLHSPDPSKPCTFTIDNVGFVMNDTTAPDPDPDPEPQPEVVDKNGLNMVTKFFNNWVEKNKAKYTADSWATYMANCQKVLDMPENTQVEVDAKKMAVMKLNMSPAIDVLVEKPAEPEKPNTAELDKAKAALEAYKEADYTADSWAEFKAAYDKAMAMAEDTQDAVDAKVKALNDAAAKLVEKPAEPEKPAGPDYAVTDTVRLNEGEKYFEITGFEDGETVKVDSCDRTEAAKHNGNKGLEVVITDGSQNGFKHYEVFTNDKHDWTGAKYFQFYIDNTVNVADANPLELFYIELGKDANDKFMLNYDAKGIKLFNTETGRWYDAAIEGNSFHVFPPLGKDENGNFIKCPSLKIKPGFKGYVRIPLLDENFYDKTSQNRKITDCLDNMGTFNMYLLYPGIPGRNSMYLDDCGIITYEGDTAPEYQNDPDAKPEVPEVSDDIKVTLTGVAKDANGNVLKNAIVKLDEQTFVTNDKGEFKFENVQNGYIFLEFSAADGTELGFLGFNLSSGENTEVLDGAVTVAPGVEGLTLDVAVSDGNVALSGAVAGAIENVVPGTANPDNGDNNNNNNDNTDNDNTDPQDNGNEDNGETSPETGVVFNVLAMISVAFLALIAAAYSIKKMLFNR